MQTCLVTGGGGFIGSHLVEYLVARGDRVRVFDDFSTGSKANLQAMASQIELIQGSVTEEAIVRRVVAGCQTIFHLAALPSVTRSIEDPVLAHHIGATGTLHVLDAARREGVRRLVYAASSSAYGDQPGDCRTESDALVPLSPYAAAKLAGEHYCRCFREVYGLETVCLRFFNVFGPRQDPKSPYSGVIALFIEAMRQGRQPTVFGDGLQSRDFVYVDNVVQALTRAAESPAAVGNVYNIGTGSSTTILELVEALNEILGSRVQPMHAPARSGDVRHSRADVSRARQDLGYEPTVSFREGLRRTLLAAT